MGRSPSIGELKLLRREADMIQQQDTIIPFPQGGKDKISPFKPRPTPETEAEMLERMNRQNKESVERLKKKKEKDLGDRLKDFDGDPDAMAMGGRAGYAVGGLSKLLKFLSAKSPAGRYKDYLASVKKRSIEGDFKSLAPELGAVSAGGILVNRKMKSILEEGNELQKERFLKEYIEELNNDPSYKDRPELKDKLIENYTKSLFGEKKAGGGRAGYSVGGLSKLLKMLQGKVGKKNITTADKIARPESALNREMFGDFNERVNRKILDVPPMPSGFQLSREKLLKNFPELDESYADEIMAMDKELQGRVLTMLKDRRKNPEAYDKLLMEKGDTLDFQGEFDRSVKRSKNAAGGLAYMLGEPRDRLEKGGPPNPGRRNFMKLMAGLASIPVLGKFFKPAAKVAKTVVPLQNTSTVMPTWFPKFVDRVIDKGVGTKIDADIMKYEVKELPGIKVSKHDDGRIYVEGQNDYGKGYDIEYQPPGYEVTDYKTGKAVKTKGDFTASEEVPVSVDMDGNADFEGEILEEVGDILGGDGRVMEEFATGKKLKTSTRGEYRVGQAEVAAENAADEAAERAAMEAEDFATGGLAKLLGE